MSDCSDYFVTFLVDGIDGVIFPTDPWPYGQYEFTRRAEPFAAAQAVLDRELRAMETPPARPTKLRTYVRDVRDMVEAARVGRDHANETIALMRLDFLYAYDPVVANVGVLFDLRRGVARGLPPPGRTRPAGLLAMLDEVSSGRTSTISLLLATGGGPFGELGRALRRSAHWRNVAKSSADNVQYVLMTWMACEVLCKVSQSDSVTDRILGGVGFVRGRHALALRADDARALKVERGRVEYWRRELFRVVDSGRRLRNAIVHSGYRDIEMQQFLSVSDMRTFRRFMNMALPRLQGLALRGLQLRMKTVAELWSVLARVLYEPGSLGVANDLLGTVLHSLEHPLPHLED